MNRISRIILGIGIVLVPFVIVTVVTSDRPLGTREAMVVYGIILVFLAFGAAFSIGKYGAPIAMMLEFTLLGVALTAQYLECGTNCEPPIGLTAALYLFWFVLFVPGPAILGERLSKRI